MRIRDEAKEKTLRKKAMQMIVEEGFDGLSMHKLAKAAGVSVATIYIYFKDREDLILSLCKEEMMRMTEATLKNFDPAMPFAEGLRVQWQNRAQFWIKNPIEAQFMERIRHSPYHEKMVDAMRGEFRDAMNTFVTTAQKRGELVKLPVEIFWSVAYAPLYQLVKFHMDDVQPFPGRPPFRLTPKNMEQALQLVVRALTP